MRQNIAIAAVTILEDFGWTLVTVYEIQYCIFEFHFLDLELTFIVNWIFSMWYMKNLVRNFIGENAPRYLCVTVPR